MSLKNTLLYALMAVPLETCFALLLALLLNWVGPSAGPSGCTTCRRWLRRWPPREPSTSLPFLS